MGTVKSYWRSSMPVPKVDRNISDKMHSLRRLYSISDRINRMNPGKISQMQYRSFNEEDPQGYWHAWEYYVLAFLRGCIFHGYWKEWDWDQRRSYRTRHEPASLTFEFSPKLDNMIFYEHFDDNASEWVYTIPDALRLDKGLLTRVIINKGTDRSALAGLLKACGHDVGIDSYMEASDSEGYLLADHYYHKLKSGIEALVPVLNDNHLICANQRKRGDELLSDLSLIFYKMSYSNLPSTEKQVIDFYRRMVLFSNNEDFEAIISHE